MAYIGAANGPRVVEESGVGIPQLVLDELLKHKGLIAPSVRLLPQLLAPARGVLIGQKKMRAGIDAGGRPLGARMIANPFVHSAFPCVLENIEVIKAASGNAAFCLEPPDLPQQRG